MTRSRLTARVFRHSSNFSSSYIKSSHKYRKSYISPKHWTLDVSACSLKFDRRTRGGTGDTRIELEPIFVDYIPSNIKNYEWIIEEHIDNQYKEIAHTTQRKCKLTFNIPTRGRRDAHIRIRVISHLNDGKKTTSTKKYHLQDFTIVSFGDSYASGEGVPDKAGKASFNIGALDCIRWNGATWQEPKAHRSYKSAPSLGTKMLDGYSSGKNRDNETNLYAITFLSYASSGAVTSEVIRKAQHDWQRGLSQVREAKRDLKGRQVDAVLLSAGGNDSKFAGILKNIIIDEYVRLDSVKSVILKFLVGRIPFLGFSLLFSLITAAKRKSVMRSAKNAIKKLKSSYFIMADVIQKEINPKEVYVTEYPICQFDLKNGRVGSGCGMFADLEAADAREGYEIGNLLNGTIKESILEINRNDSLKSKWHFVSRITAGFRGHGYCSNKPYYLSYSESCTVQGNYEGMMHPKLSGNIVTARKLRDAILNGTLRKGLRQPKQAKLVTNKRSMSFGSVSKGVARFRSLSITNWGTANLSVNIRQSRSTTFAWPAMQKTIKPGQSISLKITFSAIKSGDHKTSLVIKSNDPRRSYKIDIKGSVSAPTRRTTGRRTTGGQRKVF